MIKAIRNFFERDFGFQEEKFQCKSSIFTALDDQKADFIYDCVQTYLNNMVDNVQRLRAKANWMLGYVFAVLSLSVPVVFKKDSDGFEPALKDFLLCVDAFYIFIGVILLRISIGLVEGSRSGNEPKVLMNVDFIKQDITTIKALEAETYQKRIDLNGYVADYISTAIKISLWLLIIVPAVLGVLFLKFV